MQQTFDNMGLSETVSRADVKAVELTRNSENPRLAALLARHQSLLKRLGLKRRELQRFKDEAEEVRSHLAGFMAPLEDTGRRLDEEMHAQFAEILDRPRLSKRARREIEDLYLDLQRFGTISPRAMREEHESPEDAFREFEATGAGAAEHPDAEPTPEPEPRPQDAHRGRSGDKKNLRALFLKLASALHPDKVQDDLEKERRTELMKELNRAYRDGDVARILEIESSLSIEDFASSDGAQESEIDRRCRILASQNQLLATQYKEVLDDLLERRRSMLGEAVIEVRRGRRARAVNPYRKIVAPMEEFIEFLQGMRDHVDAFAQGKISLDALLEGPMGADDEEDEVECDCPACIAMREDELLEVLRMLDDVAESARTKATRSRAKASRKRQKASRKKNRKK